MNDDAIAATGFETAGRYLAVHENIPSMGER
jgi:hypothetical protein